MPVHYIETGRTQSYLGRIALVGDIAYGIGGDILVSAARITVYEREIALCYTFGRDSERAFGAIGHIVFAVIGRLIVFVGIYTEETEVAGMAGPHPVVGIASELADGRRRAPYQTDVAERLVYEKEILVAIVERLDRGAITVTVGGFGYDFIYIFTSFGCGLLIGHLALNALVDLLGNIFHVFEERGGITWVGQLLITTHGPEAVGQIVMFNSTVFLYVAITAVMVGEHKPLVGNHLAGTASEVYHGIFERGVVYVVKIFGREPETFRLHVGKTGRTYDARQPHPLLRRDNQCTQ